MKISRPTAVLASLSSVSLGGVIGLFLGTHEQTGASGVWIFLAFLSNLLYQVYREHRKKREEREREERLNQQLEKRTQEIKSSMRTRVTDLNLRLDRMAREEAESHSRRAEDIDG